MSDAEINIAIAEWCGWTTKTRSNCYEGRYVVWLKDGKPSASPPPDYCHDLNAIHEAESKIIDKPEVWNEYIRKVHWVFSEWVVKNLTVREQLVGTAIHATARQRSEALLRTLGLWKE